MNLIQKLHHLCLTSMTHANSIYRGKLLIHELIQCGVTDVCLAPGSRSTPLAIAISEQPTLKTHVFYDERSLGFTALGLAKATHRPVVIITTSGSAVSNLLPAVTEAFYDHIPLILLTSDRPFELHETGSNQTIQQQHLFSNVVAWEMTIPCSDPSLSDHVFLSTIDQAVFRCNQSLKPVHLNCEFREPFELSKPLSLLSEPYCRFNNVDFDHDFANTVIVAGVLSDEESEAVLSFSETYQIPIVSDCFSKLRFKNHDLIHPEWMAITHIEKQVTVIQVGVRCLDTPFLKALRKSTTYWIMLTPQLPLNNPDHLCRVGLVGDISTSLSQLSSVMPSSVSVFSTAFKPNTESEFNETSIYRSLVSSVINDKFVFLGNSLSVRLFNLYCPSLPINHLYANRGASGIDGLLSTAIGIAKGRHQSGIVFIGDTSFCYDLNALGQLTESVPPLCIVVINNGGGKIFDTLPISKKIPSDQLSTYFTTPHGFESFELIASHFNCDYHRVITQTDLDNVYRNVVVLKKHVIVEIVQKGSAPLG